MGRLIVFGGMVVLGIIFLSWERVGRVYLAVGVAVVVTVLLERLYRSLHPGRDWMTWAIFVMDSLLAAALVQMAGGFDGPFAILFFVHTFAAGAFLGVRGGVTIAIVDSLVIAGLGVVTVFGWTTAIGSPIGKLLDTMTTEVSIQYVSLLVMIDAGFLMIAGLVAGYLAEHLSFEKGRVEIALRELSETRALSREVLESLSDGVLVIDVDGRPMSLNRAGREMLGLGQGWREEAADTDVYTLLREFMTTGGMQPVVDISHEERVLECRMSMLRDETGSTAGALVSFTDITETIELKERLQEQEKLAVVGRLSSTLAHEIRNPLASMNGAAHVLRMGSLDWEKSERMTELISRQARRISEIIEGYLELSRSRKTSYSEPVSLESVVREAVDVARQGFCWQTEIELRLRGSFVIIGSQARLVQLLTNLLRNSTEALDDREDGKIVITLERSDVARFARLGVSDNGPGIRDEVAVRVQDPFFTTKEEGTGLGLYVARRVVDDHNGKMRIDSVPGGGTTVTVELPLAPADVSTGHIGGNG